MSYALDFSSNARQTWINLEVVVQEAALDELDRLASSRHFRRRWIHEKVFDLRGIRHYLFLEVRVLDEIQTLMLDRIGHVAKTL